jgi:hypothetical protein
VQVTINGYTYPSTIGTMNGVAKIPVSGAVRDAANISAGDILVVDVETGPHTTYRHGAGRSRGCAGSRPGIARVLRWPLV